MAVYFIANERGHVKIGHSINPKSRLSSLRVSSSEKLTFLRIIEGCAGIEAQMHKYFADQHIRGEWFELHEDMLTVGTTVTPNVAVRTKRTKRNMTCSETAHVLRRYRVTIGVSLADFAARCEASAATISRIERGEQWPSWRLAKRILAATGNTLSFNDLAAYKRKAA
jgi:DNA-binding XRE family transcriptional regulator